MTWDATEPAQSGVPLKTFLEDLRASESDQEPSNRKELMRTVVEIVSGVYAHLPLKKAMYAINPVQRLLLLKSRASEEDGPGQVTDADLQAELCAIVTALADPHTHYRQPTQKREGRVAALPFMVEQYGPPSRRKHVVSHVWKPLLDGEAVESGDFQEGVEILEWNGYPIETALERHAAHAHGGRPDARRARALDTLTLRSLEEGDPEESRVLVRFRNNETGSEGEKRFDWSVIDTRAAGDLLAVPDRFRAVNPTAEAVRRAKKQLFARASRATDHGRTSAGEDARAPSASSEVFVSERFRGVLRARRVPHHGDRFGYLRIYSFSPEMSVGSIALTDDAEAWARDFVDEVIRIIGELPQRGLVLDLRGNPGGIIQAAERLLQLFTPNKVLPTRFSFLASPLTLALVTAPPQMEHYHEWEASLKLAVATGEPYSQALPITSPEDCNDIGQCYSGPVIAVVDANTYSAGDIFAAGFVDNNVGKLLCIDEATGGGGANVWSDEHLLRALGGTALRLPPLPKFARFYVSVRRATRSGPAEGLPIEDVGVRGDLPRYDMTFADLIEGNGDLMEHCAELLVAAPFSSLDVTMVNAGQIAVDTVGLDALGVYVDGRPLCTEEIGTDSVTVAVPAGVRTVEVVGWDGEVVRQRRRLSLSGDIRGMALDERGIELGIVYTPPEVDLRSARNFFEELRRFYIWVRPFDELGIALLGRGESEYAVGILLSPREGIRTAPADSSEVERVLVTWVQQSGSAGSAWEHRTLRLGDIEEQFVALDGTENCFDQGKRMRYWR